MTDDQEKPPRGGRPSSTPARRDRVPSGFRQISRGQVTAAVLLAVVGFAGVVQVQENQRNDDYEGMREEDLVQLLNSLASAAQRAENEIDDLEQTRNSLRTDTDSRAVLLEQARERATVLGILAGTLPAVGPGIVVEVRDPHGNVGINQMLDGLEELRNAGAEAIEVNDTVRVVAQTALEDGPDGIIVDGREVVPPYTIEVIGDPQTLATALTIPGGFIESIEGPNIEGRVIVEQETEVEVASLSKPREPEYAQPVEPE